jgi:hypothetical protein
MFLWNTDICLQVHMMLQPRQPAWMSHHLFADIFLQDFNSITITKNVDFVIHNINKLKLSHYCHAGAKGERKYSSYSFLTSALDGVSGQSHTLAMLYPQGKYFQYPLVMRLGGPQSWSGDRG